MKTRRTPLVALACIFAFYMGTFALMGNSDETLPSVFDLPALQQRYAVLKTTIQQLAQRGNFEEAERRGLDLVRLLPQLSEGHYILACVQARLGKTQPALQSLSRAVEAGFHQAGQIEKDPDLESLRDEPRFLQLVEDAKKNTAQSGLRYQVRPGIVRDSVAIVAEGNTAWDSRRGVFQVFFTFSGSAADVPAEKERVVDTALHSEPQASEESASENPSIGILPARKDLPEVIVGHGAVGELLHEWFRDGTAAGNHGDIYDNHDKDHSNLAYQQFPQLTRVEFSDAAKRHNLHVGIQCQLFYSAVTLGNTSMARTAGPFWRSLPRIAYTDPRRMAVLYLQYTNNHLYVYPEHRDHDPGHSGDGGYGDVYCANTPYLVISQGSSGSDRAFLDALACTLAAFRPEVKTKLIRQRLVAPTLQQIFRNSNKQVKTPDDYLTGPAHPTVFEGKQLDVLKMVRAAHDMRADQIPPFVQLRVVEEDETAVGKDYYDIGPRERLFDSPGAIARVVRGTQYSRRLVVSAEDSVDVDGQALTWHWAVLRGDAEKIEIRPQNDDQSVAELVIPYHTRRPIYPGSGMESNRVDIGVFVHNGTHYSAPAFVSFYFPDNEQRVYDDKQRIQSITYSDPERGGNYVDPWIVTPSDWRDEFLYDDQGRLVGRRRLQQETIQKLTPDGALVLRSDDHGRPSTARSIIYSVRNRPKKMPILEGHTGDELIHFEYESEKDLVGSQRRTGILVDE